MNKKTRVLFLLPVRGGGGGAHCVVDEARVMRSVGVDARIAIRSRHVDLYRDNYRNLEAWEELFSPFNDKDDLLDIAASFNCIVATMNNSMPIIEGIVSRKPGILPAYLIQDYEPWFYRKGTDEWNTAVHSYTLLPRAVLMAKTSWLCETVESFHPVHVHKIECPSYEQDVFYPRYRRSLSDEPVEISAMVRPRTPRRAASRTMQVLREVKTRLGDSVRVSVFGSSDQEIENNHLAIDFEFRNYGALSHHEVADVLRQSDVFVDFSDWQAWGMTGLEAMGCGCALVLPKKGGACEYAADGQNALIVDTSDDRACIDATTQLAQDQSMRNSFRAESLARAPLFSTYRTVISELDILGYLSSQVPRDADDQSSAPPSASVSPLKALATDEFDFLDFGASLGASIDFAKKHLGGRRGLGIDNDPLKVKESLQSGYDYLTADILDLELPRDCVRFVTLIHFLEHLPDLASVKKAIAVACSSAKDFVFIALPFFDADESLRNLGLKFYWSDWTGHTCHLKSEQLAQILDSLGLNKYHLLVRDPVRDSTDAAIHPLASPPDQHLYEESVHPPKPQVEIPPHLYKELICVVELRPLSYIQRLLDARSGAAPVN